MRALADSAVRRAAWLSVGVGVVILFLKVGSYLITGSAAILSDALESVVHVLATVIMLVALRVSLAPPDPEHPYGHGRATGFSVGFEGGLVALSGILVFGAILDQLLRGRELQSLEWGLAGTVVATLVNLALGLYLMVTGKRHDNRALVADAHHVLADVWTSVGVVGGLVLVWLTGIDWLDFVIAGLVGIHLLVVGSRLVREGIATLMGSVGAEERQLVIDVLNELREPEWVDVHQLRIQRVSPLIHVDFHLTVPGDWTVQRGHDLTERIEEAVLDRLGSEGSVIIHYDVAEAVDDPGQMLAPDEPFTLGRATRALSAGSHRHGAGEVAEQVPVPAEGADG